MEIVKMEKNSSAGMNPDHNDEDLIRKNKELTTDINILKRLVYMLNVELELRNFDFTDMKNERADITRKSNAKTFTWKHEDIKMVEPLLQAFQQTKEEKDQLLQNYKQYFDDFSVQCKDIVLENDTLRQQLYEAKIKGEAAYSEWNKLHREFLLLKEHNELLLRQTKLYQNKLRSTETAYKTLSEYPELEDEIQEIKEKFEVTKTELLLLKGRCSVLSQVNDQFKSKSEEHQESSLWTAIIKEIKNLSAELKMNYSKEIETLRNKISSLETQKSDLTIKLATISSERDYLQGYVASVESECRKVNSKYETLEEELESTKKNHTSAKVQTAKCMSFIRELISIHNTLISGLTDSTDN